MRKIPNGYESMDLTWEVDKYRSAASLVSTAPVGWRFFQMNRKNTVAVVTYIRPLPDAPDASQVTSDAN